MSLKRITRTVLSYCEIPEHISESSYLAQYGCGCYVEHTITPRKEQPGYSDDFSLDNWIIDTYPDLEGMTILIDIDY